MTTRNPPSFFRRSKPAHPSIEALEPRALLSSAGAPSDLLVHPVHFSVRASDSPADDNGYTPAQIRQAYGFDSAGFQNGAVAGSGAGQTIGIVDAYNDQNLTADLAVFDQAYGIAPPPSLQIVNQTGGSTLPRDSKSWASEIALDVEWSHAIAPQANIVLVETNTEDLSNLLAGVDYARRVPAVSVVSMSWGGSEFFTFSGKEFTGEVDDDAYFTTPPGHQGVTFVAAAGDNGPAAGAGYPGDSPNVLTVGGTSLIISGSGAISSETTWSQTGGGFSQIEPEPAYQLVAQQSGARATPDVAYDADPNNGVVEYDSLAYQGFVDFQETGGNSAGTPQWAALVAIADQGRALAGEGTLDGVSQTLPALYDLYGAPGTPAYSTYGNHFNDIIDTSSGGQPSTSLASTIGYDTATGLGSPKAAAVIGALVATKLTATTPPAPTPSPTPASTLPASPIGGAFAGLPAGRLVGGARATISLRLTDAQAAPFIGPASIVLYASASPTLDSGATSLTGLSIPKLSVHSRAAKTVKLKFTYPTDLEKGAYYLIVSITAAGYAPADMASTSAVSIFPPAVELSATFAGAQPVFVFPGHQVSASLTIENLGDLTASGPASVALYASANPALDASATLLTTLRAHKLGLKPGNSKDLLLRFTSPKSDSPGTYFLLASVTSTQPPGNVSLNDVAVIGTQF